MHQARHFGIQDDLQPVRADIPPHRVQRVRVQMTAPIQHPRPRRPAARGTFTSDTPTTGKAATGSDPGLLVFDSQLTTYKILDELTGRGITWLTLRQRGKTELARLAALPASAWKSVTIARTGRYRRPRLHEDMIKLKEVSAKVRQIAISNIGRDEPTLLIC